MTNPATWPSAEAPGHRFTPKRGRPSADQREAISRSILSSATDIFLAEGYDAASMDAIAAQAGVPKSTLYRRFTDKKALLRVVIEARVSEWSAVASQKNWMLTDNLEQRLIQYCAWLLIWASSPDVRAFSGLALSAWNATEETGQRLGVVGFGGMVDLIAQDIARFGPSDGIHARDPHKVAMAFMALLSGWLQMRSSADQVGESEAQDVAADVVALLLRGSAAW